MTAGRLYAIAEALGVEVGYFFEGLQTTGRFVPSRQQQMLLELARNCVNIPDPRHREAIVALARALAEDELPEKRRRERASGGRFGKA